MKGMLIMAKELESLEAQGLSDVSGGVRVKIGRVEMEGTASEAAAFVQALERLNLEGLPPDYHPGGTDRVEDAVVTAGGYVPKPPIGVWGGVTNDALDDFFVKHPNFKRPITD
jgi:hypothetical protein